MNKQRILILRPEPGASATAARASALGLEPIIIPLFNITPVAWEPRDAECFDAVMMTSAQAARFGGPALALYAQLPLYAVGAETAAAVRVAGFATVRVGGGDVTRLLTIIADDGHRRIVHFAGAQHRPSAHPALTIARHIVYTATAIAPPPKLPTAEIILLHSARAAGQLAQIIPQTERGVRRIVPLSQAVADAAGDGWAGVHIAPEPHDDALLACAIDVCNVVENKAQS